MSGCSVRSFIPLWKESDRLAALRSFGILDTEPETVYDDIAQLAMHICQAPIALVSFVDERRQWFKSAIGIKLKETSLDVSFCADAILQSDLFVVPDMTRDPCFSGNPAVTGEPHLRFYAGAVLETREGLPLGTLCILDVEPRPAGLSRDQSEALLALARAVMTQLELRQANKALGDGQRRYRALIEASAAIVWRAAPDGSIIKGWGWESFCGQGPDEHTGSGWMDAVHPEDHDRVGATWQELIRSQKAGSAEYRVRRRDGKYRWVLVKAVPIFGADDTLQEWVGTITDIHEQRLAEDRLHRSEERYRALIQASVSVVWRATADGSMAHDFGWSELPSHGSGEGEDWLESVHPEERPRVRAEWRQAVASGTQWIGEFRVQRRNGDYRWVLARCVPLKEADGTVREWVGTQTDIHDRRRTEEALRASEERLRLALIAGRMFAWEQDLTTNFIVRSHNCNDLLGIGSGPLSEFLERVHPDDRAGRDKLVRQARSRGSGTVEFRYLLPSGETLWLGSRGEVASPNRIVGVTFDITERKEAEEALWRLANHDPLTGLPNRSLFHQRLDEALAAAKRKGTGVCLLLIDLDDFKDVNDTLGHDAGDAMLKETAARLSAITRACDTVARLGGDEFAVLLVDELKLEDATRVAENILEELRRPFMYKKRLFASRASIGVAAFPEHHARPAELMKDADIALYRAKSQGRNRVTTYSSAMRSQINERVSLGQDVREAILEDQFVPFYQPKVCLATGRITGMEALARWRHPSKGILTPELFGSVFEDHDIAIELGAKLIGKVIADMRYWLGSGLDFGRMAVNLSSAEFSQQGLADRVLGLLGEAAVPTSHFEVEVTEKVLFGKGAGYVAPILRQFKERGVQIALDDFGTGYASLMHLKQFPVNHIKIDRSFIKDLERSPDDAAIVAAVIGLARSLNLQVTAEGVETQGQVRRLREMACHNVQGFLYAEPIPGSDLPDFLARYTRSEDLEKTGARVG